MTTTFLRPKFAPIAPITMQPILDSVDALGDYQLLLAHEVVVRATEYAHYYYGSARPRPFVILDNGAAELGEPLSVGRMQSAAITCRANVIVLPDIIGDSIKTISMGADAVRKYGALPDGMEFMAVAQGQSLEEIVACGKALLGLSPHVGFVAVPKHVTAKLGTRQEVVRRLSKAASSAMFKIHLLGFSDNIADDMASAAYPGVVGIDSAMPIWAGIHQLPPLPEQPPTDTSDYGKRPHGYMNGWAGALPIDVVANITRVRQWLNDAVDARMAAEQSGREGQTTPASS